MRACVTAIPAAAIQSVRTALLPAAASTVGANPHAPANRNTSTDVARLVARWMATSAGGSSNSRAFSGGFGVTKGLP